LFTEWLAYENQEWHDVTKQDLYLAQIAAQAGNAMNSKPVKLRDYILKFRPQRVTTAESKAVWQSQTGKRAK
jgi:hypothetical protein